MIKKRVNRLLANQLTSYIHCKEPTGKFNKKKEGFILI